MNVLIELENTSVMLSLLTLTWVSLICMSTMASQWLFSWLREWCGPCHTAGGFAEQFMADWAVEDLLWVTIIIENDQGQAPGAEDLAEWVSSKGLPMR